MPITFLLIFTSFILILLFYQIFQEKTVSNYCFLEQNFPFFPSKKPRFLAVLMRQILDLSLLFCV